MIKILDCIDNFIWHLGWGIIIIVLGLVWGGVIDSFDTVCNYVMSICHISIFLL